MVSLRFLSYFVPNTCTFLNLSKSVGKGNDNMLSLMSSSSSNIGGNIGLNLDEYDGGEDDGGDIEYSSPFPK